jgi:hypothetical protein
MLTNFALLAMMPGAAPPPLTVQQIVERMVVADEARLTALAGYTGARRYRFENKAVNKRAEMTVRLKCDGAGVKTFEVTSEAGSGFVCNRILRKMIDAEAEASQKGERQDTRVIPRNYEFQLVGTDASDGRQAYVLEIAPKKQNKFLIRGRIWVDCEDFAIMRVEGSPAKNPSFWIRSVRIVQRYGREGRFWLPVLNESRAQARIFGTTDVVIEYFDYSTSARDVEARAGQVKDSNR